MLAACVYQKDVVWEKFAYKYSHNGTSNTFIGASDWQVDIPSAMAAAVSDAEVYILKSLGAHYDFLLDYKSSMQTTDTQETSSSQKINQVRISGLHYIKAQTIDSCVQERLVNGNKEYKVWVMLHFSQAEYLEFWQELCRDAYGEFKKQTPQNIFNSIKYLKAVEAWLAKVPTRESITSQTVLPKIINLHAQRQDSLFTFLAQSSFLVAGIHDQQMKIQSELLNTPLLLSIKNIEYEITTDSKGIFYLPFIITQDTALEVTVCSELDTFYHFFTSIKSPFKKNNFSIKVTACQAQGILKNDFCEALESAGYPCSTVDGDVLVNITYQRLTSERSTPLLFLADARLKFEITGAANISMLFDYPNDNLPAVHGFHKTQAGAEQNCINMRNVSSRDYLFIQMINQLTLQLLQEFYR